MFAIVDIAGQQFRVEKEQEIFVHRLKGEEGSKVEFDKVLLIENGGKVMVGKPVVEGAKISAKIISHVKGDKVLVFKKKRRKGYEKLNGHRQYFSKIVIESIAAKGIKAEAVKEEPKEEVKTETKVKAEAKPKAAPKAKTTAKPKKEAKPEAEVKPKKEPKPKAAAKPKTTAKAKKETKEDKE